MKRGRLVKKESLSVMYIHYSFFVPYFFYSFTSIFSGLCFIGNGGKELGRILEGGGCKLERSLYLEILVHFLKI